MNLTINGETQASSAETLGALVEGLGMKPDRVAVELNREIVPRDQWPQTPLHDGDRLEIVHFVGGGCALRQPISQPANLISRGPVVQRIGLQFPKLTMQVRFLPGLPAIPCRAPRKRTRVTRSLRLYRKGRA
jgi:sulfur carrier protein